VAVVDREPEPLRSPLASGAGPPAVGHALRTVDAGLLAAGVGGWVGFGAGAEPCVFALAASAAWVGIQLSPAGCWLRSVRRLEWVRAQALVRTGLARAGHRRGSPGALSRAGDAYERDGHARSALRALGAEPSRAVGWLLGIAEQLGRLR
jgi:hypothetical protein